MEAAGSVFWSGVAVAVIAYGVVLGISRMLGKRRGAFAAEVEIADRNLRRVYDIAAQLTAFSQVAAHPGELRKHDLFERGVERLMRPEYGEDDLFEYASGGNPLLACMAIEALVRRFAGPHTRQRLMRIVPNLAQWPLYFVLNHLVEDAPVDEPVIGPVLVALVARIWDAPIRAQVEDFVAKRAAMGETARFGDALERLAGDDTWDLENFVKALTIEASAAMLFEIEARKSQRQQTAADDVGVLASIGQVWDDEAGKAADRIIEHDGQRAHLDRMEATLAARPARSTLVVGDAGVGKTAAVSRLARRLQRKGWTVFVAGHTELIAGQTYLGEFEGRLRQLVECLKTRNRALWIVPGFEALAFSGRHRYNMVSALDSLMPHIEAGEVKIVAEMTRSTYEKLCQVNPRIVGAFMVERLESLGTEATLALARDWVGRYANGSAAATLVPEAWHLANHFLGETAPPGNILKLLELTRERLVRKTPKAKRIALGTDDLFDTLIELTGLPDVMLDDDKALDLDALRQHFHRRVIGQDEAVDCLVERVAMIKAGVTDPTRPSGVFLFAGPTGTGKTEIAKTLAEWLFGTPQRMVRIDMSELQSGASLERLTGAEHYSGTALTDRIREQPFSVVLLDEFEKAHPSVWDFFLQVFDDGRLTDQQGRTADFRHAIVILTSNLGAAIPTDTPIGFSGASEGFDPATVTREIEQVFRREFINRIDRVVVFRPLSREVMRDILQKELDFAFARRGLRSRSWAVEWDETAIDFLLDKGFTPDLGARPLKRAIDRYLLAPLAQTIVRRQVPEGDQFLFVTERDGSIDVEFVDPDAPGGMADTEPAPAPLDGQDRAPPTLRSIMLQAQGKPFEVAALHDRHKALSKLIAGDAWAEDKQAALSLMEGPDFWKSDQRFDILGQLECIDRIEAATRRAGSLLNRIAGGRKPRRGTFPPDMVKTIAQTVHLVETAREDLAERRPREAFIQVDAGRDGDAFAGRLADMYVAWARNRRMHYQVLDNRRAPAAKGFLFRMAVSGFGAHTLLADEAGLHVLESGAEGDTKAPRSTARVSVAAQPLEPGGNGTEALRQRARAVFEDGGPPSRKIVRRYREEPSPLVRDAVRGWRTGRADRVFAGDFDLFE